MVQTLLAPLNIQELRSGRFDVAFSLRQHGAFRLCRFSLLRSGSAKAKNDEIIQMISDAIA